MSRYTVYEADRSGECWDLCQTDDGSYALLSLRAGRAARPRNILGVFLTDDPETRGVEESLEEQELAQAERELEQIRRAQPLPPGRGRMSGHTPGSWKVTPDSFVMSGTKASIGVAKFITHVYEFPANARLIAAAPELLAIATCRAISVPKLPSCLEIVITDILKAPFCPVLVGKAEVLRHPYSQDHFPSILFLTGLALAQRMVSEKVKVLGYLAMTGQKKDEICPVSLHRTAISGQMEISWNSKVDLLPINKRPPREF